jgi:apolipoprotein N-acyltransferase
VSQIAGGENQGSVIFWQATCAAACVGLLASAALPAGVAWLQGRGMVMVVALAPLFYAIERFFETLPVRRAAGASLLCSYLCAWAIEVGFFHWGVSGIETFLGLPLVSAGAMALAVLAVHAAASLPVFAFFIVIRAAFGANLPALLGALFVMPLLEHLAPRMFYFTYGSFLSLEGASAPLLGLGGSAFPSLLIYLGGWGLGFTLYRASRRVKWPLLVPSSARGRAWVLARAALPAMALAVVLPLLGQNAHAEKGMPWTRLPAALSMPGSRADADEGERPPLRILLVQPARRFSQETAIHARTDAYERYLREVEDERLRFRAMARDVEAALASAPSRPDLVVFPESIFSPLYQTSDLLRADLEGFIARIGVPSLLHFANLIPGIRSFDGNPAGESSGEAQPNVSLAEIRPASATLSMVPYQKRQLMPYGEYLPWRPFWERVLPAETLARMPKEDDIPQIGSHHPLVLVRTGTGTGTGARGLGDRVVLGVSICFDGISPDYAREAALEGADVLINLSNLEWMRSGASEFVYGAIVRLRALETGRPLVFANNGGGSAAYDAAGGALLSPLPHDAPSVAWVEVPLRALPRSEEGSRGRESETTFVRHGHDVVAGVGFAGVLMVSFAALGRRRRREGKR